jgi:probable addiction module antidote protein
VKPVGEGVSEMRIDYGPGYRVYFMQLERTIILLLCGGDKGTQDRDIARAKKLAKEQKERHMALKTAPFDAAEVLDTEEAIEEFIAAAFETEDPAFIARALGTVARARNMSRLAEEIGMSRPALYRALSGEGNPEFATIAKVMHALGLKLAAVKAEPKPPARRRKSAA